MYRRLALPLIIVSLFACSDTPETSLSSSYEPIPPGYGYMTQNKELQQAVDSGNRAFVRAHAWRLWAGIMQQAKSVEAPVWYTWPNTTAAFVGGASPKAGCDSPAADQDTHLQSMLAHNAANTIEDNIDLPVYDIPAEVIAEYPSAVYWHKSRCNIRDGKHFQFNRDILIPTESLSQEAFDWIRPSAASENPELYKQSTLDHLHDEQHVLDAPQRYVVTKHMYWPVKADGLSAIPVWHDDFDSSYEKYAGYELWKTLVAVDPSGEKVGETAEVQFLWGNYIDLSKVAVKILPTTAEAKVHGLQDFYYYKVTDDDWSNYDDADKAILSAASYWAYNKSFEPGDYLVTVAMHINTKEIPSWALQSVWWTDLVTSADAGDRPDMPDAKGPWWHYDLVDSYGIPTAEGGDLPVAMNPYIELAIHPVATNCQTCHMRAGWPRSPFGSPVAGKSSYQNPDCPSLVAHLTPESKCLEKILRTDMQWIIPDRAIED